MPTRARRRSVLNAARCLQLLWLLVFAHAHAQRLPELRIDGVYAGLTVCGASVDRIQLRLQGEQGGRVHGTVQRSPWLNPAPRQPSGPAVPVTGSFGSNTGLFRLQSAPGAVPRGSEVALLGGLQAEGDGLVAGPPGGGVVVGSGSLCHIVVARRGSDLPAEWAALDREPEPGATGGMASLLLQIPEKLEQARDMLRRECPAPIMPWLQQLQTLSTPDDLRRANVGRLMFADEAFVPHFGKPFAALSAQERMVFRVQQSGSCGTDRRVRELNRQMPSELLRAFHNMRDFPDVAKAAARISLGELRRWRNGTLSWLQSQPAVDVQVLDGVRQWGRVLVEPLWLEEGRAFDHALVSARKAFWLQLLARDFEAARPEAMTDLLAMEQLARGITRARQRFAELQAEDLAPLQATIGSFVREQVFATSDAWAATTTSPGQAELMAEAPGSLPGIAALLDEPRREALRLRLSSHRRELVARLAQAERLALQRRAAVPADGASAVAELVRDEQRLLREYGALLGEAAFGDLMAERAAYRQSRLAAAATELEAMARSSPHGRDLARLRSTYLLPADAASAGGARFAAALDARADQIAPFRALPAGAYFDALYGDDAEGVAAFDAAFAARYRSLWEATKPLYQMADIMLSAAGGQRRVQPVVSGHVQAAYERASPITPIMAIYLGRYGIEKRYERCIEPDATRPRVRYTSVEVKKYWGYESRTITSEATVEFVINPRFKPVADVLGVNMVQSDGFAALERLFFSPDAAPTTHEAYQGVQALMSSTSFECNSKVVRRLEDRMIKHFLNR